MWIRLGTVLSWGGALLLGGAPLVGCQSSALTSGKLYLQQEKYDRAIEQLELAVQETPENPEAHFQLGRAYGLEGHFEKMAEAFDRSVALSPKYRQEIADTRLHYWTRIYNDGVRAASNREPDLERARQFFQTATRVMPERLEAWHNLATLTYQLGDVDGAIQVYRHLVTVAPQDTASQRSLGVLCLSQERYDEAEAALVAAGDEHVGALVNLAIAYQHQDRLGEAKAAYLKALAIDPDQWQSHYNLGNLYWQAEDYASARDSYARAVELNPQDPDARYNLAMAHLQVEAFDEALPLLEALSRDMPENGVVWRELGRVYALKTHVAQSEAAYARAAALGY